MAKRKKSASKKSPPKIQKYKIVPISARTGKPVKRPRRKQAVIPVLVGPRGGVKILSKTPQPFYKTDFAGMNRAVKGTEGGNFILQRQRFKKNKFKLTGARARNLQQPLLFQDARQARPLTAAPQRGQKRLALEKKRLLFIKPNTKKPYEIEVEGKTIKEAISNVILTVNLMYLKRAKKGLYYSIIIQITDPDGKKINIPVSGYYHGKKKTAIDNALYMKLPGKKRRMKTPVNRLNFAANFLYHVSVSIRNALKDNGYMFTSLTELEKIEKHAVKVDLPRLKKKKEWTEDKAIAFDQALDRLQFYGVNQQYKNLSKKIHKGGYKVKMFLQFEIY